MKREWIIAEWFEAAYYAAKTAGYIPGFIFVMDRNEEPLNQMIQNLAELYSVNLYVWDVEEVQREDVRDWKSERFERMVYLRNMMLEGVRRIAPKFFLSLDSDILIQRDTVVSLLANLQERGWDAIGGKAYLGHVGTEYPTFANFQGGTTNLHRQDSSGVFRVDCLMAIKLMTPATYGVDYEYADQGEDIGWSQACTRAGYVLGWDGTHCSKHVMLPEKKDVFDDRVGY